MGELELLREFRRDEDDPVEAKRASRVALFDAIAAAGPSGRAVGRRGHPGRPRRWTFAASVTAAAATAAVVFVVTASAPAGPAPADGRLAFSEAQQKFPSDTASDVVSYADRVAVVTAVAEVEIPDEAPAARAAAGEGTIYRRITFRVDETLWARDGAPAPPATFDSVWWGWVVHDHQRSRFVAVGAPWITVGSQYVMPLAYDEGAFSPIQPFAVFELKNSVVALSERQESALAKQLAGSSRAGVRDVFARATPRAAAGR